MCRPTFYRIYRKKSTEGFQSLPYMMALFSSMLWLYYALLKNQASLITINSFGCLIETTYIVIYLIYAPRREKVFTGQMLFVLNVMIFGVIFACTLCLTQGDKRITILGWICVGFSVSVFAAPLSIITLVIRTKSVEFMPYMLSFFLTLSAAVWLGYGLLSRDRYVALPNIPGLVFGIIQMVLYCIYYSNEVNCAECRGLPEHVTTVVLAASSEVHPVNIDCGHRGGGSAEGNGGSGDGGGEIKGREASTRGGNREGAGGEEFEMAEVGMNVRMIAV
ncbi:Bidirectional sugar transporter SWEET14 [Apostasia shenzhenica]|uniref:Bidirectional sugar transporter SWEET n=1 Tax=Apostasia shenzhenica TaxID=1088818 RepID=A0A2I0B961_9ASPA|nr:Bidirectional sugar transporter SWEET14 [Apostasia shenzhenica]